MALPPIFFWSCLDRNWPMTTNSTMGMIHDTRTDTMGEVGSMISSENAMPLSLKTWVRSSSGQLPVLYQRITSSPRGFFSPVFARNVICCSFLPTWVTTPSSIISRNVLYGTSVTLFRCTLGIRNRLIAVMISMTMA